MKKFERFVAKLSKKKTDQVISYLHTHTHTKQNKTTTKNMAVKERFNMR